jgi:outer membrane protein assembly factor BamA
MSAVAPIVLLLMLLSLSATASSTQVPDPLDGPGPDTELLPPPPPSRSGWLFVLPVVSYAPETGVAFGVSGAYQHRFSQRPGARPSTALPALLFTTKSQLLTGMLIDAWLDDDRWHATVSLGYRRFPTSFFGIGDDTAADREETFTDQSAVMTVELARRVAGPLSVGGILDAGQTSVRDLEPGGQLATGAIAGTEGGGLRGLGLSVAWDTRDAVQYPTRGWNQRAAVIRYLDALGGDYRYTWTEAQVSTYQPLGRGRVLAFNAHGSFQAGGEVPFYRLNPMGLRGYREDRHRDRHVVRGQVELRSPLRGRLGGVLFAGLGEMAATMDRLRLGEAQPMAGFGLRFDVGDQEQVNVTLDVGFGDGQSGVYLGFGEAF